MMTEVIISAGHSKSSLSEFIFSLEKHSISVLVDVRTVPYSKRFPHFSKRNVEKELIIKNIQYIYLGKQLGGKGEIQYPKKIETASFRKGIEIIKKLHEEKEKILLMCAERKIQSCHRKFIVERLRKEGLTVVDIGTFSKHQITSLTDLLE